MLLQGNNVKIFCRKYNIGDTSEILRMFNSHSTHLCTLLATNGSHYIVNRKVKVIIVLNIAYVYIRQVLYHLFPILTHETERTHKQCFRLYQNYEIRDGLPLRENQEGYVIHTFFYHMYLQGAFRSYFLPLVKKMYVIDNLAKQHKRTEQYKKQGNFRVKPLRKNMDSSVKTVSRLHTTMDY